MLGQRQSSPQRDIQIVWANVARRSPCHTALLQLAFKIKADVICVQEPFTAPGNRTSSHPGYTVLAPVESWGDHNHNATDRPRVLTYVLKSPRIKAQMIYPRISRNALWTQVNQHQILNVYREPGQPKTLEYVISLALLLHTIIRGDFNCRHKLFKLGTSLRGGGGCLA